MKLSKIDFYYYGIDCDYNSYYNCEQNGCNEEGICRCSTVYNETITDIKLSSVVKKIYDNIYDNSSETKRDNTLNQVLYGIGKDVNYYIVDRIVRNYKLWLETNYDINITRGYYGEEIGSICLKENIANKIEEEIYNTLAIGTLKDTIEHLLYMEYGSILPELNDCDYELATVDKKDIIFSSISHHNLVKKKDLEFYSDVNYNSIRGIVMKIGDKYRLIDGYHRTHITTENVKVLIAKKC